VVEALYDQFVPAETYPDLARAWQLPHWERLPQSHITILFSRRSMKRIIEWLEEQLCAG